MQLTKESASSKDFQARRLKYDSTMQIHAANKDLNGNINSGDFISIIMFTSLTGINAVS